MKNIIANTNVITIGDPHFGRKFVNGVPLNRRGEREKHQMEVFIDLLNDVVYDNGTKADVVVIMGDLFDAFSVEEQIVIDVYNAIAEASWANPDTDYVILQGNHDITRNKEQASSLDILERMLVHRQNIVFVREWTVYTSHKSDSFLMFPYDPFMTSSEAVEVLKLWPNTIEAAFGHWDVDPFGNDSNIVPINSLKGITNLVYTGHIHSKSEREIDGIKVVLTGSMLPYTHGEDQDELIYVTRSLSQVLEAISEDPKVYHDKSLRVILKKGEELPPDLDVLQLAVKYVDENNEEENIVITEVFSFKDLFDECMNNNGVSSTAQELVWKKYMELNRDA